FPSKRSQRHHDFQRTDVGPHHPRQRRAGHRACRSAKDTNMRLSSDLLARLDAYFAATNYIAAAQIYLLDNPLLKEPLRLEHIKPRLLGHWGTCPGINFAYEHLSMVIRRHDFPMLLVVGPGHGAPASLANAFLEGSYTDFYPDITLDEKGL